MTTLTRRRARTCSIAGAVAVCAWWCWTASVTAYAQGRPASGQAEQGASPGGARIDGQLIVTFRADAAAHLVMERHGAQPQRMLRYRKDPAHRANRTVLVGVPPGRDLDDALARFVDDADVESVQPNYRYSIAGRPEESEHFALQWALDNSGDSARFQGIAAIQGPDPRTPNADIAALEAYASMAADGLVPEPVLVADIDTGVDLLHEDFLPVLWVNPGEIADNDIDDDDNGCVDDVHGCDFSGFGAPDGDPFDGHGHGSHTSGVIAAAMFNDVGMAGIAPNAQLMVIKGLDDGGSGSSFGLASAILYAGDNGALLSNNSWGAQGFFDAQIQSAIEAVRGDGHLFVAAAGNSNVDMDTVPFGPAGMPIDNIISVLATTAWKDRAVFSNFGSEGADIGAPGHEILSTTPGVADGFPDRDYQISFQGFPWSGTSMAAPQVTGAATIVFGLGPQLFPEWETLSAVERMGVVRDHLLARSEPWPSLSGITRTDGHLNLAALVSVDVTPPAAISDAELAQRSASSVSIAFTAPGDDDVSGRALRYDVRVAPGDTLDFETAERVRVPQLPVPAGAPEVITVDGLRPATRYTIAIRALDEASNAGPPSNLVTVTTVAAVRLFGDDVERGINGWVASGGFAISTQAAASPARAWNDSPGGNYPNNTPATLTSRIIPGATNRPVVLRWKQRKDFALLDLGIVEVVPFVGSTAQAPIQVAFEKGTRAEFHERVVRVGVVGDALQLRFRRESSSLSGAADGWIIDDIEIFAEAVPTESLFTDAFGSGANWRLTPPWRVASGRLTDGGAIGNTVRASATTGPFNFANVRQAVVRLDVLQATFGQLSGLMLEYSVDDENWLAAARLQGAGPRTVDLGAAAGQPAVYLRLRIEANPFTGGGRAEVDNFRVVVRRATFNTPNVTITSHADNQRVGGDVNAATPVTFSATAVDTEDGPLTAALVWRDVAGNVVGAGGTLSRALAIGRHAFSVAVSDHDGQIGSDSVAIEVFDDCPDDPAKAAPGACGCGVVDVDADQDGTAACDDACDDDPGKSEPGVCGCGVADVDSDGDQSADCQDACAADPAKIAPGACGCGVADVDSDDDGTFACDDACDDDPAKIAPGVCGCGVADDDTDSDDTADCIDGCAADGEKIAPGICGCGVADADRDNDDVADCHDECPDDPAASRAGACGCGVPDDDTDGDTVPDCFDECPNDASATVPGPCGCGTFYVDGDDDDVADCADECPDDPAKSLAGACGCGAPEGDGDADGAPDCVDECPTDANKAAAGLCGCGAEDVDSDGDGALDCVDACDSDPDKIERGDCGCGAPDVDDDNDGITDCKVLPPVPSPPPPTPPPSCAGAGATGFASPLWLLLVATVGRRLRGRRACPASAVFLS